MRVVVQRVSRASVEVEGSIIGAIDEGLLLLVGATEGDGEKDVGYLVKKIPDLRIFEDDQGKMNRSLIDRGGALLVVSQFTLYGDTRKGRRPSFVAAMAPQQAEPLIDTMIEALRARGLKVETGRFGAEMKVDLLNQGPVTLILETRDGKPVRGS